MSDWVIDLGPGGGDAGGEVVVEGTPETVAQCSRSHTGRFLKKRLNGRNQIIRIPNRGNGKTRKSPARTG